MAPTADEIRSAFVDYFVSRGHKHLPSGSLIPGDDPTLLFTNAGMNQFKDIFVGEVERSVPRAVTSQKCMRVSGKHNDLDKRRPFADASHVLRDAGQLFLRRLFQSGSDPHGLGALCRRVRAAAGAPVGERLRAGRRGGRAVAAGKRRARQPHRTARQRGQLLVDGGHRSLRSVLRDLLRLGAARRWSCRRRRSTGLRLGSLRRAVESRLHAVQHR